MAQTARKTKLSVETERKIASWIYMLGWLVMVIAAFLAHPLAGMAMVGLTMCATGISYVVALKEERIAKTISKWEKQ